MKNRISYTSPGSEEYGSFEPDIRSNDIKTLLILPIKRRNGIIGLLNVGSMQIKPYNNVSLENLSSIGLQLGLALERFKLTIKLKDNGKYTNGVKNSKLSKTGFFVPSKPKVSWPQTLRV